MTKTVRAASTTMTHDGNDLKLKVEQGDQDLENSQKSMMLIDPDELESGFTHSTETPKMPGDKKAPTTAAVKKVEATAAKPAAKAPVKANGAPAQDLVDKEVPKGAPDGTVELAELPNEEDPSAGYLEKEAGMPVLNNASVDDSEFHDEGENDIDSANEFDDLPNMTAAPMMDEGLDGEFEDLGTGEPVADENAVEAEGMAGTPNMAPAAECADFASPESTAEEMPLLDVDGVPDDEGTDDLAFACVAGNVLVLRKDRVIASMGPKQAKKIGAADVYDGEQYQAVTAHAIEQKGLRKGLVQQGFVLSKVKMTASAATAKVVAAKVEAGLKARHEQLAARDKALEHSIAIASVGINKRFFKDAENPLKDALIAELKTAGVRGAEKLVANAFAEHGPGYAKSIMTLANRIVAAPEEVRNQYADALDMTSDEDFMDDEPAMEVEGGEGCIDGEDEFEDLGHGATVTAALSAPSIRKYPGALLAGMKDAGSHALLFGDTPLVG